MSALLLRGRTWYPTNSSPLPYRRTKTGLPRDRRIVHRAHASQRHAQPVRITAWYVVQQATTSIVCGVVVGIILTLSLVGPVLYGMGVAL